MIFMVILLGAVVQYVQSNTLQSPLCSDDNSLLPHNNCNKFYRCSDGSHIEETCGNGLLYDPNNQICDSSHKVVCGDRINPDHVTIVDPFEVVALKMCSIGFDNWLLSHRECNKFYNCGHGTAYVLECPLGLLFNKWKNVCDWPRNVWCLGRKLPVEFQRENMERKINGNSIDNDGDAVHVIEGDKTKEHVADNEICDVFSENAHKQCALNKTEIVILPHEDCSKFYICGNGKPHEFDCPQSLVFNTELRVCDYTYNVNCNKNTKATDVNYIDEVPVENCEDTNEDETRANDTLNNNNIFVIEMSYRVLANIVCRISDIEGFRLPHNNCHKYYKCLHRKPVVGRCENGYLYNHSTWKCEFPSLVDCGLRYSEQWKH